MSVINTNVQSLIAQNALRQNNAAEATSLQRLSTGLQINTGADNPSGLIASESLDQETTGLSTAISNATQATNVVATADGGLGEVSNLLTQLQGLLGQAANSGGLSSTELAADQQQVDSVLNTINKIAGNTTFDGTQLLNGNLAYATSSVSTSTLENLQINTATVPSGGTQAVTVKVVGSAKTAELTSTSTSVSGGAVTLSIAGAEGSQQLTFASGTATSAIAAAVNNVSAQTGVSATVASSKLQLNSQDYGSAAFVSLSVSGTGTFTVGSTRATGTDAKVQVNGAQADVRGLAVTYRASTLDVQFNLASSANVTTTDSTFNITGGGATFQIGDKVNAAGLVSIGIGDVSTASLGDSTDGYLNTLGTGGVNSLTSTNLATAQKIVTQSISQVSTLRGTLGAFTSITLGSQIASLNVAFENASSANSAIVDTDFAAETANLTRDQILAQSATTVLAQANAVPDEALTLLSHVGQ